MNGAYKSRLFDLVKNRNGYTYYKLYINDVCPFEKFCQDVKKVPRDEKSLIAIFSMMEMFGAQLLPNTKFRQIKGIDRTDVFKFKKNTVRVYVVKQTPNVYLVMGGYKGTQDKDIERLKAQLKKFE